MPKRGTKQAKDDELKEWLKIIPVKNCDFTENEDGIFVLRAPKSENVVLQKIVTFISKRPFFKFKLDDHGSFIWKNCDGQNSIGQICKMLEKEFGDSVKPTADRTIQLFKNLYHRGLVKFFKENSS